MLYQLVFLLPICFFIGYLLVQGVLDFRVALFIGEANPILEAKAVFTWAKIEAERPPSTRDIFEAYRASRAEERGQANCPESSR